MYLKSKREMKNLNGLKELEVSLQKCQDHSLGILIYRELKDVIICGEKNKICPRRWDELEVDFDYENMRHCSVCKQDVMNVTNQHNLEEIKGTDVYICVPFNGALHQSFSEDLKAYVELYLLVQVSRMTIQGSGYSVDDDIHSNSIEEIVRSILLYLENDGYIGTKDFIRNCEEYAVDFVSVFEVLSKMIEYKEFQADVDCILMRHI